MRILVGEVREPSTRLTIVDTPSVVTITNDLGQSRVLHLTGREESIDVESIPISVARVSPSTQIRSFSRNRAAKRRESSRNCVRKPSNAAIDHPRIAAANSRN